MIPTKLESLIHPLQTLNQTPLVEYQSHYHHGQYNSLDEYDLEDHPIFENVFDMWW